MIDFQIQGDAELLKAIEELPPKVTKKFAREAVQESIPIIVKQVRSNARTMVGGELGRQMAEAYIPDKMRSMRDAAGAKGHFDPASNSLFVHITKAGNRQYIPNAVEYGHVIAKKGMGQSKIASNTFGKWAKSIERKGATRVAPIPFIRRAVNQVGTRAQMKTLDYIDRAIVAYWEKGESNKSFGSYMESLGA